MEIPKQAQQMIGQFQNLQQQLQAFAIQKQTMSMQKHEIERAIDELETTEDKEDVYKVAGPVMIKSTKAKILGEMKERIEKIDTGIKRMEDHEKRTASKMKETQESLEKIFASKGKEAAD